MGKVCSECPRTDVIARGYCTLHYQRWKNGVPMQLAPKARYREGQECAAGRCHDPVHGSGYCQRHYDARRKEPCPECGSSKGVRAELCHSCRTKKTGSEHPSWKGGRMVRGDGYAWVYCPDDPRANCGRYMKEHVLVMEQMLGRLLLPGENVHHKNGIKDDNRPGNLELWVVSQPAGQRPEDLVAWALQILERYGAPELVHG